MAATAELGDDVFFERFDALMKAFKSGDDAQAAEIARTIPLTPGVALQRRRYMSKEDIIDLGFDMSLVEAELGKDWYEAP